VDENQVNKSSQVPTDEYHAQFRPQDASICQLAIAANAPVIWVFGQIARFLLCPDAAMSERIHMAKQTLMTKAKEATTCTRKQ